MRGPSAGRARSTVHSRLEPAPAAPAELHRSPPITLRQVGEWQPWLVPGAVALAVLLGLAAAVDGGRLLVWDAPLADAFVSLRTPTLNRVARGISRVGSTPVVITAGVAGVGLAARRCRALALVMAVTIAARPPFEWLLKEVVERPRPSGARLVPGTGFAYPSGHVLAAAATWGFVPIIAALYLRRRWLWWALSVATWTTIGLIAWSRVWLGVHWTSDVVGGLAIAFVALSMAEAALDRQHHCDRPCTTGRRSTSHRRSERRAADQRKA